MSDDRETQRNAICGTAARHGYNVSKPESSPTDAMLDEINAGTADAVVTFDEDTGTAKVTKIERP